MHNRRDFLSRTLGGSSLLAVGSVVPGFVARTAAAADDAKAKSKDTILVVVELSGGNDGLNTVIPYGDDLYHKARPTLALRKKQVLALDDFHGLHPRMGELKKMYDDKSLAVVQGVGYPNPDRSHFESLDVWQQADPKRGQASGWLARTIPGLPVREAGVPGLYLGENRLPVAFQGADGGAISLADRKSFRLQLTGPDDSKKARKSLIESLNADGGAAGDLAGFVRKRQLQTYTSLQRIEEALKETGTGPDEERRNNQSGGGVEQATLADKLNLIAKLVNKGLGTRLYYAAADGFDTHSRQAESQADLLGQVSQAIGGMFGTLKSGGNDDRVVVMTYSEFGRRVKENGSRGTDHGAAACMFVAGPKVAGGIVGKHPSLSDLTDGDLAYHTDFRRVYATLLDGWLGVESRGVLGDGFEHLPLLKPKA